MLPKCSFTEIIVAFIFREVKVFLAPLLSQFALSLLKALSLPKQINFLQSNAVFIIGRIKHHLTINYVLKRLSIYNLWPCRCSANADKYTACMYINIKHNKNFLECSRWVQSEWIMYALMVNACCNFSVFILHCNYIVLLFLLEFVSLCTFLLLNQYVYMHSQLKSLLYLKS